MKSTEDTALVDFLTHAVNTVKDIESRANEAVAGTDGQEAYEDLMRQKATFLASLADEAEPFEETHPAIFARLEKFSASANSSLSVGSVFFMSALLYPEDHRPGQPNDLESLLAKAENL